MRSDFTKAGSTLNMPRQRENYRQLHDWLVNELALPATERVLAVTNYQQGRFGRMPSHVLLVTSARIAYTHDGGLRALPLSDLDPNRLGLKTGVVNGELVLATTSGEELIFRRGMSLAIQEVSTSLEFAMATKGGSADTAVMTSPFPNNNSTTTEVAPPEDNGIGGVGDEVVSFQKPIDGVSVIRIEGNTSREHFAVWTLSPQYEHVDLLTNTSEPHSGYHVLGANGPVAGLQITASGPWRVTPTDWDDIPDWRGPLSGVGPAVWRTDNDLTPSTIGCPAQLTVDGSDVVAFWAYGSNPSLLVNAVGPYTGTVLIPAGTQFTTLSCSGRWNFRPLGQN
ncbi:hypothetical protein NF556_16450 [Ornithinimicrobium faecis]|uniref:Uncharacterized protein n=1 Tax=Ornithinimicrobium faecis TaxID=2934158 RepID=A0ABY4YR14_9MICO|nr:hypothetical protein [Ornithinimicrobium sp. HY1793]USQ79192.1 hypothetical protein NF556_16450 [Ornithinimicrobium sp. HY1793]